MILPSYHPTISIPIIRKIPRRGRGPRFRGSDDVGASAEALDERRLITLGAPIHFFGVEDFAQSAFEFTDDWFTLRLARDVNLLFRVCSRSYNSGG